MRRKQHTFLPALEAFMGRLPTSPQAWYVGQGLAPEDYPRAVYENWAPAVEEKK